MKRWHRLQVCACCYADQLQQTRYSTDTIEFRAVSKGMQTKAVFVALLVELANAL